MNSLSPAARALGVGAAALAARVAYLAAFGRHVDMALPGDHVSYNHFARVMLAGWSWLTYPIAVREPVYPAFLAFAYAFPTGDLGTLQVLQAVVGAAAAAALYLGLRRPAGEPAALLSALLVAFHPHFVPGTVDPLRENLIVPEIVGLVVTFFACVESARPRNLLLHALAIALLAHTDVRFLPLAVLFPLMALASHRGVGLAARQSAWLALFLVLLMVPYQVRGYVAMKRPIIVTERFLDRWLPRASAVSTDSDSSDVRRERWLSAWEARKRAALPSLSPVERSYFLGGGRPLTAHLAVHWFLFKEYWRFAQFGPFYRPYPDGRFDRAWSLRHNLSSSIVMIPFFLLLPLFFFVATPAARRVVIPLLVYLLGHNLLHVMVHARERYRIPLEVITGIVIAVTLVAAWDRLRPGSRPTNEEAGGGGPREGGSRSPRAPVA